VSDATPEIARKGAWVGVDADGVFRMAADAA
jgi:hypothetical protein